jgi:CheY-like chemotaxis protein
MKEPDEQRGDQCPLPAPESTTILVVDDDALIRTMLTFYLGTFGYTVLLAGNGEKAVQVARDHPEIRIAILDVVMSGLCGQELADELKLTLPKVAILFSSGHPASAMSRHGIDLRAAHFLQKPCLPPELKCKLEEMLVTR